jgi:gamma-glutamylcyclotransferase (GGCT)/AIG2-like uncharacterized protein YtfP
MLDPAHCNDAFFFAYGANLSRAHMAMWCPGSTPVGTAHLADHRLVFRTWADITASPGHAVQGALYQVSPRDLVALDEFADCPALYHRIQVTVQTEAGPAEAIAYRMNPGHPLALPDNDYVRLVLQGYEDWRLDLGLLSVADGLERSQ